MLAMGLGWLAPVSLQPFGFPGCTLYVAPWGTVSLGAVGANGQSPAWSLSLPNDPSLRDLRLGLQAGALGTGLQLTAAVVLLPGS